MLSSFYFNRLLKVFASSQIKFSYSTSPDQLSFWSGASHRSEHIAFPFKKASLLKVSERESSFSLKTLFNHFDAWNSFSANEALRKVRSESSNTPKRKVLLLNLPKEAFDKVRGVGVGQGWGQGLKGRGGLSNKELDPLEDLDPFPGPAPSCHHLLSPRVGKRHLETMAGASQKYSYLQLKDPLAQNLAPCLKGTEERLFSFSQIVDQTRESWSAHISLSASLYLLYRKRKALF